MATTIRETERKYDVTADGDLPSFADLAGVAEERDNEPVTLEATYFDTADLRLAREGITLRRRVGGADEGWHLKLPAGGDDRDEVQAPLGAVDSPPDELSRLVAVRTRGAALVAAARLTTVRHARTLLGRSGDPVAEVVDDRVSAVDLGAPSPAEQVAAEVVEAVASASDGPQETVAIEVTAESTVDSWREVEVELIGGTDAGLFDLVEARLGEAGVHRSTSPSKLRRALAGRLPAAPRTPRLGRKPTAIEALRVYLHAQYEHLKNNDVLARQDGEDAVHQLRVACRRMRSTLHTFGTVLDREQTAGLVDELRWLGVELGGARNLEVFDELLRAEVDRLPADLVVGPVSARLTKYLARGEEEARAATLVTLNSERYFALLDALDALLAAPPTAERAHQPAAKVLPAAVAKAYKKVRNRVTVAAECEGEERDAALHDVRKAAKRLRYATELARPAVGKPAKRYGKSVKKLQEVLGDHHDAAAARPLVRELGMQAHLEGENGFTFGLLFERLSRINDELEAEVERVWAQVSGKKNRAWMKR